MFNRKSQIKDQQSSGFTLVELLIVIGIIAVLISILLPAVSKVRIAAQKVATQNTINRLAQGCEQYFQDFNAYPGPFADGQLAPNSVIAPVLVYGPANYTLQDETSTPFTRAPTSSENLFLGLCGGLRFVVPTTGTPTFIYDNPVARRGTGPRGLGTGVAKKSQSYMELSDADISVTEDTRNPLTDSMTPPSLWWGGAPGPAVTAPFVGDTAIFEFMDRFSKAKPILYLRAQRGTSRQASGDVKGFILDRSNATTIGNSTPFQYDPALIQQTYSNIGLERDGMTVRTGKEWKADVVDYPNAALDPASPATGANVKFKEGNERYFVNEQVATGDPVTTAKPELVLIPQHKDGFILISAGADGIYGTADDIRN